MIPADGLRDIPSIQAVLEAAIRDTSRQENSTARNRTLGYLAGIALRAVELGALEDRLSALEALVVNGRSQGS